MLSRAGKRLADDHATLGEVLNGLRAALNSGDAKTAHAKLDLFWARLAVHIRAEHLHLFPAITQHAGDAAVDQTVRQLRADHDFFMHELARAMAIMRGLLNTADASTISGGLQTVREFVSEVEQRLVVHNELEENQVYRLTDALSEQDQAELSMKINKELANQPPRFSVAEF
jgi:iron-sulfur cluster repair protein YtfE (RIC family)